MDYALSNDDMRFAIEFTSQIFADKEPTSVALGVTSGEFTDVFRSIMEKSILSGYSYASHWSTVMRWLLTSPTTNSSR